jgi:polyhydroxyalkanoate synthase
MPRDRRFASEDWRQWPYNLFYQAFLLHEEWWRNATTGVRGVNRQHQNVVGFGSRQILDMFSPSNFLMTNPTAARRTFETGGLNLLAGFSNFLDDLDRAAGGRKPAGAEAFQVGRDVAVSPGKVIFRNRLIELIQYAPTTDKVRPEPVLIVPAWIMKYYILDLSPGNSVVRYLTGQGFTVFMISWKNPTEQDRELSLDDYLALGPLAAVDVVASICGDNIHAVGYCLGGTLLAIAAAAMARDGDKRLKTVSLFAAQADFTEAGELTLFINESQVSFLEDLMWRQGYLDSRQMAGVFSLLRSNDLIWSYAVHEYLMGEREPMIDLMAWNADATRLPFRMHSQYLRQLFLDNDLAEGRFKVDGRPIALSDIKAPIFAVGTQTDHVAPWRSAFKIHLLTETDVTFLLTTGGHNAGVVSPPGAASKRSYQVATKKIEDHYVGPDAWRASAPRQQGSWWPEWVSWLAMRSGAEVAPPAMAGGQAANGPLADAPGAYVLAA